MKLTNRFYDVLMYVAQVILPALGTLYFAITVVWSLPDGTPVIGTITAIDVFLGACLKALSATYVPQTDGTVVVDKSDPAGTSYNFKLENAAEVINGKNTVTFKVVPGKIPKT